MTDRQRRLRGWDQDRISRTRVLIAGAGALGNELLKNLLMLGVGKVFIADHDRVEVSNLNRCIFFTIDDAFKQRLKVEALAEKVKAINPAVEVVPIASRVEEMRKEVFDEVDLALGALDSLEARLQLNIECCVRGKPLIDGGIEGLSGQVQVVIPPYTPCIECGLTERDRELLRDRISCGGGPMERDEGVVPALSPIASLIAAIQALEAIKVIHGLNSFKEKGEWDASLGEPLAGKRLFYSGLSNSFAIYEVDRSKSCAVCTSLKVS